MKWILAVLISAIFLSALYGVSLLLSMENEKDAYATLQYADIKYRVYPRPFFLIKPTGRRHTVLAIKGKRGTADNTGQNPLYAWIVLDLPRHSASDIVMNPKVAYDFPCSAIYKIEQSGTEMTVEAKAFLTSKCAH